MATLQPGQSKIYPAGTIGINLISIGGESGEYEIRYQGGRIESGIILTHKDEYIQTNHRVGFTLVNTGDTPFKVN